MTKKIIELEEGTERIVMSEYASVDDKAMDYPNGDRDVLVENLPDAPNRPTIELPLDLIEDLEEDRWRYSDIREFLMEADIYSLRDAIQADPRDMFSTFREATKVASEFYLGYIDLVPKKAHKFTVAVDMHDEYGNLKVAHAWKNTRHGWVMPYIDDSKLLNTYYNYMEFTEEEADNIARGLSALNARKVQVEESK